MKNRAGQDWWKFEKEASNKGFLKIAGLDEAGRGPLAGPVVSAAVILPDSFAVPGINDSKKLTPLKRDYFYNQIRTHALATATGIVDSVEIDRINILQATLLSMLKAVKNLDINPDFLLVDGTFTISSTLPQSTIIKGDSLSISIAAASIIAKVTRDRLMKKYDEKYPQFGFARHKGYPTKVHKEAIKKFGPSSIHRHTFKGVKEYL
ncbi:MAG: ribonuclease HII [Desulfosarcina sp.]|nr:ribonuclease HII [Desulfobacterales bacterium]